MFITMKNALDITVIAQSPADELATTTLPIITGLFERSV